MASLSELTTLRDEVYAAYRASLTGKDVMFDGHRVTIDDSQRLLDQYLKLDRMITRMGGSGQRKNNVGIIKRD